VLGLVFAMAGGQVTWPMNSMVEALLL
jgi:hypothetical protein